MEDSATFKKEGSETMKFPEINSPFQPSSYLIVGEKDFLGCWVNFTVGDLCVKNGN